MILFDLPDIIPEEQYVVVDSLPDKGQQIFWSGNLPIIQAKVNGENYWFVLDTGSTISTIDIEHRKKLNFKIGKELDVIIYDFNGTTTLQSTENLVFELNDKTMRNPFATTDLSMLISAIERKSGHSCVGILGSEVFRSAKMIIDYSTNRLYFKD